MSELKKRTENSADPHPPPSPASGREGQGGSQTSTFLGASLQDLVAVWLIVSALLLLADWRRQNSGPSNWLRNDMSRHIGAEYDTIAVAIRNGRGFSDPFRAPSGPTAWMPPILVYFTSGLYWLTGDDRESVVEIIILANAMVIVFSGVIVVGQSRTLGMPLVGYALLTLGLLADFFELFQRTHDTWLVLLVLNLLWVGMLRLPKPPPDLKRQALWGAFGGFCALCSPAAGFTWAATTTFRWLPRLDSQVYRHPAGWLTRARPLAVAATVSIVIISPWMVRNRIVMGKWVPVKSNAVYEIWQSQVLDDNGVLDAASALQHPWVSSGPQRKRYLEIGELQFVGERWQPVVESIREDPVGLVERIGNRWFAACLYYLPLHSTDENLVWPMRLTRTWFPLPFLFLTLIVLLRRFPLESGLVSAICIYVFTLSPYILISYYGRYAAPLVVSKVLLVLYGIDTLRQIVKHVPRNQNV